MKTLFFLLITLIITSTIFSQPKRRANHRPVPIGTFSGCGHIIKAEHGNQTFFVPTYTNNKFLLNKNSSFEVGDNVYLVGTLVIPQLKSKAPIIRVISIELCTCCLPGFRGDVNKSGNIDIADLVAIISWIEDGMYEPECSEYLDMNGDDIINRDDIMYLINYMFEEGPFPVECNLIE